MNFRGGPKIMRKIEDPEMVSASEIASYAFCPVAWRLASGLGLRPNNERQLARGEDIHAKTAAIEERSQAAMRPGVLPVALGRIALVVLLLVVGR